MIAIALAIVLLPSVVQGQNPTIVAVKMGDTANFTLSTQANSWSCLRNKKTIDFSGRYGLVNNNMGTMNMSISQVVKDDYGLYTCIPNNDPTLMEQFSLIVVEPILMDVNQVTYNLNDNVTVTCKVTFYMTSNLMLNPDQDLVLYIMCNGNQLAKDSSVYTTVTDIRTRNLTYTGNSIEDMRTNNVTCLLRSQYLSETTFQRVYITTPPKAAKIANKSISTFNPGQTLVCTVDSYPLLTVSWKMLSGPCQNLPTYSPPKGGMATLTLTANCLGQQTWSCTATWTDSITIVNDTFTFTVVMSTNDTSGSLGSDPNAEAEKKKRDIGLGVGLGLGIPLLILIVALILVFCFGVGRGGSTKKSYPTKTAQATPKKTTAPAAATNPNPNPNFHALPDYNQVAKSGNGVSRGGPGVPDIGVAHINGSGSIPQLNSSLDGQINFRTDNGAVNLGRADLGMQNRSFTNI